MNPIKKILGYVMANSLLSEEVTLRIRGEIIQDRASIFDREEIVDNRGVMHTETVHFAVVRYDIGVDIDPRGKDRLTDSDGITWEMYNPTDDGGGSFKVVLRNPQKPPPTR